MSDREREVVELLFEGNSNKLIASALHITESTVEFHLKNIYSKLKVSSRLELVTKLGKSTVAKQGEVAENGDGLNLQRLADSFRAAVSRISKEIPVTSMSSSNARTDETTMTFFESIRACFTKYAEFNGRASRAEFWWFALFITLVASALAYLSETLAYVFLIAVLLPLLAAGTRRQRDSGKSGWWQLFLLVLVGGIVVQGFLWAMPPVSPLPDDSLPA